MKVAASLVFVQGALTVIFGGIEAFATSSERVMVGASTALFFILYGGLLVGCAWALFNARSWARGPVLLTQLMWLGLGWNLRNSAVAVLAVVAAVSAIIVLVGMLHRDSIDALENGSQNTPHDGQEGGREKSSDSGVE